MVYNFPDEISWFINRITNIRSRFGLILETYRSNLKNGKQYSTENLYLIGRRQLLPGTGSNHGDWSHFRFEPMRTPPVRTGANHGKPVIERLRCERYAKPVYSNRCPNVIVMRREVKIPSSSITAVTMIKMRSPSHFRLVSRVTSS